MLNVCQVCYDKWIFCHPSAVINVFSFNTCLIYLKVLCEPSHNRSGWSYSIQSVRRTPGWIHWTCLIDSQLLVSLLLLRHTSSVLAGYGAGQGQLLWRCYIESDLAMNRQHYLWINYPAFSSRLPLNSDVSLLHSLCLFCWCDDVNRELIFKDFSFTLHCNKAGIFDNSNTWDKSEV